MLSYSERRGIRGHAIQVPTVQQFAKSPLDMFLI